VRAPYAPDQHFALALWRSINDGFTLEALV
jgi:hypothetical protein